MLSMAFFAVTFPNAVILRPVTNMYSSPSADASVVSQAIYGSNVAILEQREDWAKIRTSDDYSGWSRLVDLRLGRPYASGPVGGPIAEVQSLFAHIYREPSVTRHEPLLTVPFETRLEIIPGTTDTPDGRWFQARLADGGTGWIHGGDLTFEFKPLDTPGMIALAKRFLGFPYTWGGRSSFGYDCSGFMQMLERRRGILMPRDAQPQAAWSGVTPVERKDLQPGDLLYFGKSPDRITHTGMYLGHGQFISATAYQTPTVRIADLNDPHWAGLLVAMRRVK